MYLKNICIKNFRNINDAKIDFNKYYNIFYGNNAQGKTNIIESVFYLINAKSYRENTYSNLIAYDKNICSLKGSVVKNNCESETEIIFEKNNKRTVKINGNKCSANEMFEENYAVIFSPDDLRLIKDGPEKRRKFLDNTLCKIDANYKKVLSEYDRLLKHRNKILKAINDYKYSNIIEIFDQQISRHGSYIIKKRLRHLNEIEKISQKIHNNISQERENLKIHYQCSIIENILQTENISEIYRQKLFNNFNEDIKKCSTSAGPHTDDIIILLNGKYCKKFASQGQQKTASVALKLSEIEIYKNYTNQYPVVLLDDVLSELDESRQQKLLYLLKETQVMITDTNDKSKKYLTNESYKMFEIEKGQIKTVTESDKGENINGVKE